MKAISEAAQAEHAAILVKLQHARDDLEGEINKFNNELSALWDPVERAAADVEAAVEKANEWLDAQSSAIEASQEDGELLDEKRTREDAWADAFREELEFTAPDCPDDLDDVDLVGLDTFEEVPMTIGGA